MLTTTQSPTTTVIFSLLLLLLHPSTSSPILGLDSFLTQQFQLDPHASNDTLLSLPSHLKFTLSSTATTTLDHRISSLLSLSLPISIHIKLVGPSFTSSSASTLSSFLSASHSSSPFHVITPFDSTLHHLSLSHSLHHYASLSSPSLSSSLSSALRASLASSTSSLRSSLFSVAYSVVDEIIAADFRREKPLHGYTVYLINLGAQSKPYAYTYSASTGAESSSPSFTKCLGSVWQSKDRYIWVDLGAGPVDYGPGLSGDGVLPKGEFHPLAAFHGKAKSDKAVLADLASLVYSAYQVLLVPSLRIPVPFENNLVVQFIHVVGSDSNDHNSYGLDWKLIENALSDEGLLLGDQSLSFKKYEINYKECALCSFAVSKSKSSYTSRFLFDNYTLIVSEYVDSKKLHQILSDSADEFKRLAGVHEEDDFKRVIPVYVFDLDDNTLLMLDRFHQSVAFKDMVIAIRTRNTQTVSDYSCNGRHVFTQTRELERPIIGSVLQSMWGVSPTHLRWSPRHNTTLVDYTWSVGQTPFGPFSEISSLSFVQKDAARRNVLLTTLNYTVSSAIEVLQSVKAHGGYQRLLKDNQVTEFSQRWSLFKYKLDKMITALSHLEFELASYYLRSSEHDLYAMHSIIYRASQELDASLVCFTDPPVPWASVSMSAATFIILCFVYAKRDKFFKNKTKQF
ncbi:uncharacterized protein LOC110727056 [Chenopodium quinoa]|uniref:DUF7906 domain-containing protein n=1 Tax=Chenopodium quinoa TaxID=63459 RepID=A0A803ML25_CHEQI|nr:uncharacterized protein LOC110727056 [Chenopodium quinoa]